MAAAAISKNLALSAGTVTGALSAPTSTAIMTLTQADILGMFASPIVVVPAAPNVVNFPVSMMATFKNPGSSTVFAGGGDLRFGISSILSGLTGSASTITTTRLTAVSLALLSFGSTASFGDIDNRPIVITNSTGAFTGGAATSTLTIQVDYIPYSIA